MGSPFLRPKKSPLEEALGAVLGGINVWQQSKADPNYRVKEEAAQLANMHARQELKSPAEEAANEQEAISRAAAARLGVLGKLTDVAASGIQGYTGEQDASQEGPHDQMTVGATDASLPAAGDQAAVGPQDDQGFTPGDRGFAVSTPNPLPPRPDFLPAALGRSAGIDLPAPLKDALLRAAHGKAEESKLALAQLKAREAAQARSQVQTFNQTRGPSNVEQYKAANSGRPVLTLGQDGKPVYTRAGDAIGQNAYVPPKGSGHSEGYGKWAPAMDDFGNFTGQLYNPVTGEVKDAPSIAGLRKGALTGTAATRTGQAGVILDAGQNLIDSIPNVADKIGPLMGRGYKIEQLIGNPDPDVQQFATELSSFIALQPALHGFRGHQALAEFERMIGGPKMTPESLAAGIQGVMNTAAIAQRGARPRAGGGGTQTNPGRGAGQQPAAHGPAVARKAQPGGGYLYRDAQGNVWSE